METGHHGQTGDSAASHVVPVWRPESGLARILHHRTVDYRATQMQLITKRVFRLKHVQVGWRR